jgi:hypothetical protein
MHDRRGVLHEQVRRKYLWLQTRRRGVCWLRRLLHGCLQQRRLRSCLQTQWPAVHDRRRVLHGRLHDERLRHGELPVRRFVVSELLAAKLLPIVRHVPSNERLHAEGQLLHHLRRQWWKRSDLRPHMLARPDVDRPLGLRQPELRDLLPLNSSDSKRSRRVTNHAAEPRDHVDRVGTSSGTGCLSPGGGVAPWKTPEGGPDDGK